MASDRADAAARWHRSPDLAVVESEGRVAVLHLAHLGRDPLILEGTAHAIWRALTAYDDLDALNAAVAADFGMDPADTRDQVLSFLESLEAAGVLV